jgi:hypothetical protein
VYLSAHTHELSFLLLTYLCPKSRREKQHPKAEHIEKK